MRHYTSGLTLVQEQPASNTQSWTWTAAYWEQVGSIPPCCDKTGTDSNGDIVLAPPAIPDPTDGQVATTHCLSDANNVSKWSYGNDGTWYLVSHPTCKWATSPVFPDDWENKPVQGTIYTFKALKDQDNLIYWIYHVAQWVPRYPCLSMDVDTTNCTTPNAGCDPPTTEGTPGQVVTTPCSCQPDPTQTGKALWRWDGSFWVQQYACCLDAPQPAVPDMTTGNPRDITECCVRGS